MTEGMVAFVGRLFGGGGDRSSTASAPAPRAIAAPAPPLLGDPETVAAGDAARIAAGQARGRQSTIATGPFGMPIEGVQTGRKTLLGQ